jgi:hypothetical protein
LLVLEQDVMVIHELHKQMFEEYMDLIIPGKQLIHEENFADVDLTLLMHQIFQLSYKLLEDFWVAKVLCIHNLLRTYNQVYCKVDWDQGHLPKPPLPSFFPSSTSSGSIFGITLFEVKIIG